MRASKDVAWAPFLFDVEPAPVANGGYARVALNVPASIEFSYAIPTELAAGVALGTRVAVPFGGKREIFAPIERLGVIVVDEEHEPSFKQASTPRYHARDVALERARSAGSVWVNPCAWREHRPH